MLSHCGTSMFAVLAFCAAATSSQALDLQFRGTALPGSVGNVFIYQDGGGPSTSFSGQPVTLAMSISDSPYGLYVDHLILSWSSASYSYPYLVNWVDTGYPNDPAFDGDLGVQSTVNLTSLGGEIRIYSTSAYVGEFDGGLLLDLTYAFSSPHPLYTSFTDAPATGGGMLTASVNDSYDPTLGPYDADSEVTFEISSVTQIGAPEPATWALILVGFGLLGASVRARREEPGRLGS